VFLHTVCANSPLVDTSRSFVPHSCVVAVLASVFACMLTLERSFHQILSALDATISLVATAEQLRFVSSHMVRKKGCGISTLCGPMSHVLMEKAITRARAKESKRKQRVRRK